jgi:nitrogen regulatory protein P-II 1
VKKVEAIVRPETLLAVEAALEERGFGGFTIADVRGHGNQPTERGSWRGEKFELHVVHKIMVSVLCEDEEAPIVVDTIMDAARTGTIGDGIVIVTDVGAVFLTRTGERVSAPVTA